MSTSEQTQSGGILTTPHDQKLTALLQQISQKIEAAQSKDDLIAAISQVKAFDGPLKFKHSRYKLLALICALIAAVTGFFADEIYLQWLHSATPFTIFFALCTVGLLFYMRRKSASVHSLAKRLYLRALLFDNHLRELTSELPLLESRLFTQYFEFRRGNYSRKITAGYEGNYQGKTHTFDYAFYHFHYVDQRTETETDSKGNTKTRTVYDHYDRYGIALDFRLARQLAITSKAIGGFKGERYKPSSNRFNRLFKVVAGDEMTAARFLKPAVVLACEEAADHFKALNLEFSGDAGLCMSFDNNKVVSGEPQYDFNSSDGFIREVGEENLLPELHTALDFIHTLMVFSDNNFRKDNE